LSPVDVKEERAMNAEHSSVYDTTGLYRGTERIPTETIAAPGSANAGELAALDGAATSVAHAVRPAASAVLMYSEYLLAAATGLPRDQRAILDLLRRQAHVVMWGLSALVAADAERARGARPGSENAIA
jgi:hypothetical protein